MKVYVLDSQQDFNAAVTSHILAKMKEKPDLVLGLATGSTPLGVYEQLIRNYQQGKADFSEARSFNLDEYFPIRPNHPQSYYSYMLKHLFDHVNIDLTNTHIPRGDVKDVHAHCIEYEFKIKQSHGIDLQLLGIGRNGHIGFNEPGTPFGRTTHVVDLSRETIEDNSRFFDSEELVPTRAITMGIKTIMQSKEILLMANGEQKAQAIWDTINGPVTESVPASVLQLHPNVTFYLDRSAASLLLSGPSSTVTIVERV